LEYLKEIVKQLKEKIYGLSRDLRKVTKKQKELEEGQIKIVVPENKDEIV
jgi:hypothetical protein